MSKRCPGDERSVSDPWRRRVTAGRAPRLICMRALDVAPDPPPVTVEITDQDQGSQHLDRSRRPCDLIPQAAEVVGEPTARSEVDHGEIDRPDIRQAGG